MQTLAGWIVVMGLVAAPLSTTGASPGQAGDAGAQVEPTAAGVVARYLEAIGGIDALKSVESRRTSYWVHMLGRDPYLMERSLTRPDTMRSGRPGGSAYMLTERETSWRVTPEGRRELPPTVAGSLSKRADIDGPFVDSEVKGITLAYAGVTHYDMTELHHVTLTFRDGVQWECFFDARTGLLRKVTQPSFFMVNDEIKQGPDTHTYFYDYRLVGSLSHPHHWIQINDDHTHLFVVEDIQHGD